MEFQTNQDKVSNSPIPQNKLIELIETSYVSTNAEIPRGDASPIVDTFLKKVLEQLNKHSSQYKYVVSMTSLGGSAGGSGSAGGPNPIVANAVGASWNSKKDGLFNYTLTHEAHPEEQYLVTLIWIAK